MHSSSNSRNSTFELYCQYCLPMWRQLKKLKTIKKMECLFQAEISDNTRRHRSETSGNTTRHFCIKLQETAAQTKLEQVLQAHPRSDQAYSRSNSLLTSSMSFCWPHIKSQFWHITNIFSVYIFFWISSVFYLVQNVRFPTSCIISF